MEPLILVLIGILLVFAWEIDRHLRRIVSALEARPVIPQQFGASIPQAAGADEVELLHQVNGEWTRHSARPEGHKDIAEARSLGWKIRRNGVIEEGE